MPDMKRRDEFTVMAVVDLDSMGGRNILSGIFDFINKGHRCKLRFVQDAQLFSADQVRKLAVDGVIARLNAADPACRALARSPVPTVLIAEPLGTDPAARATSFIRLDNRNIGQAAAQHLGSRGLFRAFAFYTSKGGTYWSDKREKGFREELRRTGHNCAVLRDAPAAEPTAALLDWLDGLPKPVAVFASHDEDACRVLDACHALKIAVPTSAIVLGMDNDESLCNLTRPTLSSIEPDHFGVGFAAAEELERMIRRPNATQRNVELEKSVRMIAERGSTRRIPPAGHLIQEALAFIRKNAATEIRPDDIAAHLGISRRLLDLRVRQILGRTVLSLVREARLAEVKRRLRTTNASIVSVAKSCGFSSAARLATLFRREFDQTLTAWRSSARGN